MHEIVCTCMWRSEVGAKYLPWWFSTYILSNGLSLSPELPTGSLAGQLAPEITPAQYICGYWRFKHAPSICRTSILTLEPFSSPQHWSLARDRMESQFLSDIPSILSWNLQAWMVSTQCKVTLAVLSLIKFIPKYFILLDAVKIKSFQLF